jgi:hypothetical protein
MGHGRGRGKTKPISGSRALAPAVLMGETPMLRGACRRHREQGFCAKRTQFRGGQKEG